MIANGRSDLLLSILDWVLDEQLAGRRPTSVEVAKHFNMTTEEAEAIRAELEAMGELG